MKTLLTAALSVSVLLMTPTAQAEANYPSRAISFVVPFTPGGAGDLVARIVATRMATALGQPVVVENRGGASGNVGSEYVTRAAPDGHTILIGSTSSHAINPSLYKEHMPYDVARDFKPVIMVGYSPHILLVNNDLPVSSVAELIAYAADRPGQLNFSSGGNGTTTHLAGEYFAELTGTSLVHIPYKGAPEALQGVIGGQTQLMFENLSGALPQVKSGRLRGLAVTSANASPFADDLPTLAQTLDGFESGVWFAIFVPSRTPDDIVDRLNAEINQILAMPEVEQQIANLGMEVMGGSREHAASTIREETEKWAAIVHKSGAAID